MRKEAFFMEFNVITDKTSVYTTDFKQMIEKKTLLKTKLKLLQIAYFDYDLQTLHQNNLTLSSLNLSDFKLTETYNLFVPIQDKIINGDNDIKLRSYLIYLSYIYNIDLISLYEASIHDFYDIIFRLNLPEDLRRSLMSLLSKHDSAYFSTYLPKINTGEYREIIYNTSKTLSLIKK